MLKQKLIATRWSKLESMHVAMLQYFISIYIYISKMNKMSGKTFWLDKGIDKFSLQSPNESSGQFLASSKETLAAEKKYDKLQSMVAKKASLN